MPRIRRWATKKAKESLGPWPKKGVARPARGSERYAHPGITTKGDAEAQESRVLTIAYKEQSALARLNQAVAQRMLLLIRERHCGCQLTYAPFLAADNYSSYAGAKAKSSAGVTMPVGAVQTICSVMPIERTAAEIR
jgi:hypothetical protein